MKKLLFIYNPHAGKGLIRNHLASILDTFTRAGYLVTVHPTQRKGDATAITAQLAQDYDLLVCSGGDGTLNETLSGLVDLDRRPAVGYIPAGTTNDFARNLNLPRGMEDAAATAVTGEPRLCDIGRFNGRPFVYVAAFGAFTDVAYATPQEFKNLLGHLAYMLEGAARLPTLHDYFVTLEHDGGTLEGEFLFGMVSNTVSVGGFKSMPADEVKLDDGLFEVMLVRRLRTPADLQALLLALAKPVPGENGPLITFHSSRLRVTCQEPLPWTLDGEYGGDPKEVLIENCPRAVTIVQGP